MANILNQKICPRHKKPMRIRMLNTAWGETEDFGCEDCVSERQQRKTSEYDPSYGKNQLSWHF